ncbi:PEPxxWA-CTERM sorting domain-containing protein [Phenylobacterium sp.]|uniref:PEPxxWA-CTERM sorting domain-containing protein n=1 Tax=Phenylobacterium sp. TaxID=1871053 RepID=UPI0027339A4A|nr:PEPxxWA-CTERM sorting domain-containing protein [Phenylobacterium sp.]
MFRSRYSGLLAGAALGAAVAAAGAARADDDLTWSYASARVSTCVVGVTCGQSGGLTVLGQETSVDVNTDSNGASVHVNDYSPSLTPNNYGMAFASAEAGTGLLALPVLKAYASGGGSGFGTTPNPTIAVNIATVQAIQGYTNTSANALLIPLSAFTGLVDYEMLGSPSNPGTVYAGLAITTSAILDSTIAAQWFGTSTVSGFGQFTGSCGTPGALALSSAAPAVSGASGTQYLPVTTSSCTGSDAYTLNPGDSFYVWSRLSVVRASFGVTDASHTFNVTITPEAQPFVQANLVPSLMRTDGASLNIPTSAVPEPSTWAMMILGFGGAGAMLRRRRFATI